jgi:hypothetical protein
MQVEDWQAIVCCGCISQGNGSPCVGEPGQVHSKHGRILLRGSEKEWHSHSGRYLHTGSEQTMSMLRDRLRQD